MRGQVVKIQVCYCDVRQEGDERKSIVQQILHKSTDFLRRIVEPVGGLGGRTLSYVCPHCHRFQVEDYIWWVSTMHGKKQSDWWCAACRGTEIGGTRTESLLYRTSRIAASQRRFGPMPNGACVQESYMLTQAWQIGSWEVTVLCHLPSEHQSQRQDLAEDKRSNGERRGIPRSGWVTN